MSDKEKQVYEEMAAEDKKRYQREKEEFDAEHPDVWTSHVLLLCVVVTFSHSNSFDLHTTHIV